MTPENTRSSPLPALNPTELADFLAKTHRERTDEEYSRLIQLLREERGAFIQAQAEGRKNVKSPSAKVAKKVAGAQPLPSADDLLRDLQAEGKLP